MEKLILINMHLCIHNWVDRKFGSFCMSESNKRLELLAHSTESSRFPVLIQSLVFVSGAFLYASAAASSSSMQIRQVLQSGPHESKDWLQRAHTEHHTRLCFLIIQPPEKHLQSTASSRATLHSATLCTIGVYTDYKSHDHITTQSACALKVGMVKMRNVLEMSMHYFM